MYIRYALGGLLLVVVVLGIFLYRPIGYFVSSALLSDFDRAVFAFDDHSLYTQGIVGWRTTVVSEEHLIIDADRHNNQFYAILKDAQNRSDVYQYDVYRNALTPITTDGLQKEDIAVSPDGAHIVFTYKSDSLIEELPVAVDIFDIRQYRLARVVDGRVVEIGAGLHPVFVSDSILFFVSPQGFTTYNLITEEQSVLADPLVSSMRTSPVLVGGNMLALKNNAYPAYTLVELTTLFPLQLSALKEERYAGSVLGGFSDGSLVGVEGTTLYTILNNEKAVLKEMPITETSLHIRL
jgi:hypothetical protein